MIHGVWVSFQTFICGKSYILGGRYRKWVRYFEQVVFAIIVKLCLSNDLWRYSILSKMAIGFQLFISAHWVGSTTQYTTPAIWVQVWDLVPKMLCNLVMKAVTRSIHTNLARTRILKGARENASVILQELPTAELDIDIDTAHVKGTILCALETLYFTRPCISCGESQLCLKEFIPNVLVSDQIPVQKLR